MTHVPAPAELTDFYGRRYRIGVSDRDLLGHSRHRMLWLCCALMLAAGLPQYGFAVLTAVVARAQHWSPTAALSVLAFFVTVQAAVAFPAARLRDRGLLSVRAGVLGGGLLCAAGLLTAAHADALGAVLIGYSVCGGAGAGLLYSTCLATATRWYPEHSATLIGVLTGAFAAGVVPPALLYTTGAVRTVTALFDTMAVAVLVIVVGCGWWLRSPPDNWWPVRLDPRVWALDKRLNPSLRGNRAPLRAFTPAEARRTPVFTAIFVTLAIATTVFLADLGSLAVAALGDAFPAGVIAAAFALLIGGNALARVAFATLSDRLGRRRSLVWALVLGAIAQVLLIGGLRHDSSALLLLGAGCAALGPGCCLPLCAALVHDWFGRAAAPQSFAIIYGAKAFGAIAGLGAVAATDGDPRVLVAMAALAIAGAVLTARLRQPGLPSSRLPGTT